MHQVRRILVAVKDTASQSKPVIAKAAQLAKALRAELELYHCIAEPLYVDITGFAGRTPEILQRELRQRFLARLDVIAARLRRQKIKVSTTVEWDYPVFEATIRRALRTKADLIVSGAHVGRHTAPWLLKFSDWELLRQSPVPVLLVKNQHLYRRPAILAAVDPMHAFDKPMKLDKELLELGATLQSALRGTLHAVHAYVPLPIGVATEAKSSEAITAAIRQKAEADARARLDSTLRKTKIPAARRHLIGQHPIDAIQLAARRTGSAIVVMGALSRSGIARLFIGNTAEQLIDRLTCDILVVKPPRFRTHVARAKRGVRYVTPPVAMPM